VTESFTKEAGQWKVCEPLGRVERLVLGQVKSVVSANTGNGEQVLEAIASRRGHLWANG
jgi:hypothetical protein